jgi:hypothetical protein
MAVSNRSAQPVPANKSPAFPPKKKPSMLGSLFATKEPTQIALNQVTAQIIAQHGSTSARKVPHVRMEKMPEHVPKVNSKWDGIPETIKERDRRTKERDKILKRQSAIAGSLRPTSIQSSEKQGRHLQSAGSSSRGSSRARSVTSRRSDPRSPNPHKFYAQSVNSSGDLASQQRSEQEASVSTIYTQSFRSQSTTSLPSIVTSAPFDAPATPSIPEKYRSGFANPIQTSSLNGNSVASKTSQPAPPAEEIPEHSRSPIITPRTGSPVTPSTQQAHEAFHSVRASIISSQGSVSLESSGPNVLSLPTMPKKRLMKQASDAFLAGEARPLELPDDDDDNDDNVVVPEKPPAKTRDLPLRHWENIRNSFVGHKAPELQSKSIDRVAQDLSKRPDSSRSRLGLKASMLVRNEAAPWEGQHRRSVLNPQSGNFRGHPDPTSPKRLLPSIGSLRKKES